MNRQTDGLSNTAQRVPGAAHGLSTVSSPYNCFHFTHSAIPVPSRDQGMEDTGSVMGLACSMGPILLLLYLPTGYQCETIKPSQDKRTPLWLAQVLGRGGRNSLYLCVTWSMRCCLNTKLHLLITFSKDALKGRASTFIQLWKMLMGSMRFTSS